MTDDKLKGETDLINRFKDFFNQQNQKVIDNLEGRVSFWNDASLKETVEKLQVPCNNTKSKKEFTCNVGFRDNEGNCMIKWDCSMSEWSDEICPLDF